MGVPRTILVYQLAIKFKGRTFDIFIKTTTKPITLPMKTVDSDSTIVTMVPSKKVGIQSIILVKSIFIIFLFSPLPDKLAFFKTKKTPPYVLNIEASLLPRYHSTESPQETAFNIYVVLLFLIHSFYNR